MKKPTLLEYLKSIREYRINAYTRFKKREIDSLELKEIVLSTLKKENDIQQQLLIKGIDSQPHV